MAGRKPRSGGLMRYSISTIVQLKDILSKNQRELVENLLKATKESSLKLFAHQIDDLIKIGLLVTEDEFFEMVRDDASDNIKISQSFKVTLKDKEYIEKLEAENLKLKNSLQAIRLAIEDEK